MIHFLAHSETPHAESNPEVLARLAGLKRALRLVDPFGGGPASDIDDDIDAACWADASEAVRRCFDMRSERSIASAAAGLEAVLDLRSVDRKPNDRALRFLAADIRAGLADLTGLLRRSTPAPCPWG